MLGYYLFCLILGGGFVLLSMIAGASGGADFDGDVDVDVDMDVDVDVDVDVDGDLDVDQEFDLDKDASLDQGGSLDVEGVQRRRFRPWLSFKFYTYAMGFFGLTGVLLHLVGRGDEPLGISLAVGMGLVAGLGSSYLLHYVASNNEGSRALGEQDFVGVTGRVLLPIQKGQKGKVRVQIGGRSMDLRAETEDEQVVLDLNQECFVLGIEDGIARVVDIKALEERRE